MVPDQSTAKIRGEVERPRQTLNVRIPGHLADVLTLLVDRWARGARSGAASVVRTLLHRFGDDPAFAKEDVLDERDPDLSRALERALAAVP